MMGEGDGVWSVTVHITCPEQRAEEIGYLCPTPEHVKSAEMEVPHGPERLGRAGQACRGEVYP